MGYSGYHRMQMHRGASWGVAPNVHQYNQRNNISENPHLRYIDLGPEIKSLRTQQSQQSQQTQQNGDIPNTVEPANGGGADVEDSPMIDKASDDNANENTNATNNANSNGNSNNNSNNNLNDISNGNSNDDPNDESKRREREMYSQSVLGYLSEVNNISNSQRDLVFAFFTKLRTEQQRLIREQEEKIRQQQAEQRRKEQRDAGGAMLISVVPWLTLEQAKVVMVCDVTCVSISDLFGFIPTYSEWYPSRVSLHFIPLSVPKQTAYEIG